MDLLEMCLHEILARINELEDAVGQLSSVCETQWLQDELAELMAVVERLMAAE